MRRATRRNLTCDYYCLNFSENGSLNFSENGSLKITKHFEFTIATCVLKQFSDGQLVVNR